VGLAVGGIHCLGSVSVGLYQYLTFTYPNVFDVEEVEIENKMAHWGGALNRVRGGKSPRGSINPNTAYFSGHEHRFLLREFSAYVVLGHFIIQTDENHFWDPNRSADVLPLDLTTTKDNYHGRAISQRADALQIDVRPA